MLREPFDQVFSESGLHQQLDIAFCLLPEVRTLISFVNNIPLPSDTLIWRSQGIGLVTSVLGSIHARTGAATLAFYVSVLRTKIAECMNLYVSPVDLGAGLTKASLLALFVATGTRGIPKVHEVAPKIIAVIGTASQTLLKSITSEWFSTQPFRSSCCSSFSPCTEHGQVYESECCAEASA